ncbi:hypothetical protein E2C01_050252 [Portunus trituberculatus]|uniref:Uncharacterized protein n=1 Tax=Portunus trituberculatus TaxID=210409 RepID=A0A5B7GFL3_PORTR|nr:hypothetical protein [Portunus trituberculatus]
MDALCQRTNVFDPRGKILTIHLTTKPHHKHDKEGKSHLPAHHDPAGKAEILMQDYSEKSATANLPDILREKKAALDPHASGSYSMGDTTTGRYRSGNNKGGTAGSEEE